MAAALLTVRFIVEVMRTSTDEDIVGPLIFSTIVHANQAILSQDAALRAQYDRSGDLLPDALRRPISINALAQSLRLPFETVRRRTHALIAAGRCVSTPHGLYVPGSVIASEWHTQLQMRRTQQVLALHAGLRRAGCLPEETDAPLGLRAEHRRQTNRMLSGYVLRTCDRVSSLAGGIINAAVFVALLDLTTIDRELGPESPPPVIHPSSARALGEHLAMPRETVRRRLAALQSRGLVARAADGLICTLPDGHLADLRAFTTVNLHELQRLFLQLRRLAQGARSTDPD